MYLIILNIILIIACLISYIYAHKLEKLHKSIIESIIHELDGVEGLLPHDNIRLNKLRIILNKILNI